MQKYFFFILASLLIGTFTASPAWSQATPPTPHYYLCGILNDKEPPSDQLDWIITGDCTPGETKTCGCNYGTLPPNEGKLKWCSDGSTTGKEYVRTCTCDSGGTFIICAAVS